MDDRGTKRRRAAHACHMYAYTSKRTRSQTPSSSSFSSFFFIFLFPFLLSHVRRSQGKENMREKERSGTWAIVGGV